MNLLNALAIVVNTTVRRSVVDRDDLKPYWKSEKDCISLGEIDIKSGIPFPNILKCKDHR